MMFDQVNSNMQTNSSMSCLAHSEYGMIQRCRCHAFSLTMGQITLHLSVEQFTGIMDLFNKAVDKEPDFRWR